jgi:two-component system, chemotaxis family, CheB/CheR fusion protein
MKTNTATHAEMVPSIVGLGSSAGGLVALKTFFNALPAKSPMVFVVVSHHDPAQPSHLADILSKQTSLPVVEVNDTTPIVAGHVYVCTSQYLRLKGGALHCEKRSNEQGISLPIDFFFRTLAEEAKEKSICVVLSGTGSDGTLGLQAIKGEGGMAMAQDTKTAQFSDMPNNAINTGLVDYILSPEKMPERLLAYTQSLTSGSDGERQVPLSDAMSEIITLLRQHTGNDFTNYKTNTLTRRIERRMNVHHIADAKHYIKYLTDNTHEIDMLFRELLIGVTSFFRDEAAFEVLAQQALPQLLAKKAGGDQVRVWVAGCSTGEEAYSLAILFQEYMLEHKKQFNVQIFATDLDEKSIIHARNGVYTEGIALDITPARLQRHFNHEGNHYQIKKHLREMVIFATQNLTQDPPFTKLDMISCRNLLIYLDAKLQKRIIPLFHYSLRPGGILFLGSSETVGAFADLFTPLQSRWKILQRKEVPLSVNRLTRFTEFPRLDELHQAQPEHARHGKNQDITELAQKLLLKAHIPPSIIVNEKGNLFFIHGRTGLYLEPPAGPPNPQANVLDMAREGLQLALAAIIRKAAAQDNPVTQTDISVKTNGHFSNVTLQARKITEPEAMRGLIWVTFESEEEKAGHSPGKKPKHTKSGPLENEQLESELHFIKQNLQSTIEELEAANEELKSTNEELQSTNEELQSANEELETAKEEMQSLNEELQTVNIELETKIRDLSFANDDMKNLLNSTGIATLFLDNSLNILRFTNQAKRLINLIQSDIGRPIGDIVLQLEYDTLVKDATEVLQTLVFKEVEVRARDWSWYLMRIMPYRTAENVIEGLVITFVDITKVKKSEILLATQKTALELIVKESDLSSMLDEVLLTIEKYTSGLWCSISLLSEDGKTLHHGAAPSLPQPFNDVLDGVEVKADSLYPCAQAVMHRRSILIPDMVNDPAPNAFHKLALKYDLQACWSQPIILADGRIAGAFTTYYKQAHHPSDIEEALINQTIPLMGLAIDHQREQVT